MSTINTGTDISGLSANTSYSFVLYPINTNGQEYNNPTTVTFTTNSIITTNKLSSINSYSSLSLGWSGSYTSVDVSYSSDGTNYIDYGIYSGTSATITNLNSNTRYYFKLTPINKNGVFNSPSYITDTSAVTMGNITTFGYTNISTNSVTLSWTGIYSSVDISYSSSGTSSTIKNIDISSTSILNPSTTIISSLTSGTTYKFNIYPYNSYNLKGIPSYLSLTTNYNSVSLLMVGGGGGGGKGGGGGGGVLYGTYLILSGGSQYTITIGSGGSGGSTSGTTGSNTTFTGTNFLLTAKGGGGGGAVNSAGLDGGCGGGAGTDGNSSSSHSGGESKQSQQSQTYVGTAPSVYGYAGGNQIGDGKTYGAAAGGGAGGVGGNSHNTDTGGNGGDGALINITGSDVYYAAGGGGGSWNTNNAGSGGNGGGGNGSYGSNNASSATGYGSGGGGAGSGGTGGSGSSGIVILRVLTSILGTYTATTGPSVSTDGDYTIISYTSNGTYTPV